MGFFSKLLRVTIDSIQLAIKADTSVVGVVKFIVLALGALGLLPIIVSLIGLTEEKDILVPMPLILSLSIVLFVVIAIICFSISWVRLPRLKFVERTRWVSETGVTHFAVKIQNVSAGKTIKDCRVELVSLDPPATIRDGVHISLHCSGVKFEIQSVAIHAQDYNTFDVFAIDPDGVMSIVGYHKDLCHIIDNREYLVTLRATGEDVPPVTISFPYTPGSVDFPLPLPAEVKRIFHVNPGGDGRFRLAPDHPDALHFGDEQVNE